MGSLTDFALNEEYKRIEQLGDKLAQLEAVIDWEAFRPIVAGLYDNRSEKGGRPNIDEVVMIKLLVLQAWYGLSDPELERQVADRISFRRFLGSWDVIPDHSTVWLFRERLTETGKDQEIWEELQRQLVAKGYEVKKGVIQDASVITADPGQKDRKRKRKGRRGSGGGGGGAKTRRSLDGTWLTHGKKSWFGYKLHVKTDMDHGLVRALETTTASVHDNKVDLSRKGEVRYADKGYFGVSCRGFDAGMQRGVRGHPLGIRDKLRNKRIARKRSPGERPFAVIKEIFGLGHVRVTTVARTGVKMLFACFVFNMYQLRTLAAKEGV